MWIAALSWKLFRGIRRTFLRTTQYLVLYFQIRNEHSVVVDYSRATSLVDRDSGLYQTLQVILPYPDLTSPDQAIQSKCVDLCGEQGSVSDGCGGMKGCENDASLRLDYFSRPCVGGLGGIHSPVVYFPDWQKNHQSVDCRDNTFDGETSGVGAGTW
jgi:hypothetical protein